MGFCVKDALAALYYLMQTAVRPAWDSKLVLPGFLSLPLGQGADRVRVAVPIRRQLSHAPPPPLPCEQKLPSISFPTFPTRALLTISRVRVKPPHRAADLLMLAYRLGNAVLSSARRFSSTPFLSWSSEATLRSLSPAGLPTRASVLRAAEPSSPAGTR